MDSTAFSLCMDNKMPIIVFDFFKPHNLKPRRPGRKSRHAGDEQMAERLEKLRRNLALSANSQLPISMPELPEVEVLARHLRPSLRGKTIRGVDVRREKVLRPTSLRKFRQTLLGAKFKDLARRGKYLLFGLQSKNPGKPCRCSAISA